MGVHIATSLAQGLFFPSTAHRTGGPITFAYLPQKLSDILAADECRSLRGIEHELLRRDRMAAVCAHNGAVRVTRDVLRAGRSVPIAMPPFRTHDATSPHEK